MLILRVNIVNLAIDNHLYQRAVAWFLKIQKRIRAICNVLFK